MTYETTYPQCPSWLIVINLGQIYRRSFWLLFSIYYNLVGLKLFYKWKNEKLMEIDEIDENDKW